MHLARSYGALLVAEFVESPDTLRHARDLGFTLFQGNLLERAGVLDRAGAPRVEPLAIRAERAGHTACVRSGERRHSRAARRSHPV